MTNPTSNFGWQMPTSTDLVTDLPADFEVFGQAVDTDFVDLLGGTTGQVLSKTSNTDLDFTWVAANPGDITGVTAGTGISGGGTSGTVTVTNDMATTITAAGDIVVGTGSGTYDNLPIGTTNQILTADTTVSPYKVKWATPAAAASGLTLINRSSFSGVATTTTTFDGVFSSTYAQYLIVIENMFTSSASIAYFQFRVGSTTQNSANYTGAGFGYATGGATPGLSLRNMNAATQGTLSDMGTTAISGLTMSLNAAQVGASGRPQLFGNGMDSADNLQFNTGFYYNSTITATGFILSAASGNITGTVAIYGLAKV